MRARITKQLVDRCEANPERDVFLWDTETRGFGLRVTRRGVKSFVLQYRKGERDRRMTLGRYGSDLTLDEARALAAKRRLEVLAGGDPAGLRKHKTIRELADAFLFELKTRSARRTPARPSTLRNYKMIFDRHVVPEWGPRSVEEIRTSDVEELLASMAAIPYMANRTLAVVRRAFNRAESWGWRSLRTNPTLHVSGYQESPRARKKGVMLTSQQMSDLLASIDAEELEGKDPYALAAIRVAFWTGWRANSEILPLKWEDIDLESGRVFLGQTKTEEEEYRMLPSEAIDVLKGLPRVSGNPHVFPGRTRDGHLTTLRRAWSRIRSGAGIDDVEGLGAMRLHDLRHNVVSWDVSRGASLKVAGASVGHRSLKATEVYAHFLPDHLKKAADDRARAMREAVDETENGESIESP